MTRRRPQVSQPSIDVMKITYIQISVLDFVQEFLRVGYYAQTEYTDDGLRENPPDTPLIDRCAMLKVPCTPSVFERGKAL